MLGGFGAAAAFAGGGTAFGGGGATAFGSVGAAAGGRGAAGVRLATTDGIAAAAVGVLPAGWVARRRSVKSLEHWVHGPAASALNASHWPQTIPISTCSLAITPGRFRRFLFQEAAILAGALSFATPP